MLVLLVKDNNLIAAINSNTFYNVAGKCNGKKKDRANRQVSKAKFNRTFLLCALQANNIAVVMDFNIDWTIGDN